ncbi:MAG: LPS assembly lipoprotein LptE [Brachymonas sp.]|nr:LPS assembly lipoprotein LptE [Brachymonas sp.]
MQTINRRQWMAFAGFAAALVLAGCGFRLRGLGETYQYPFQSIYIAGASAQVNALKRMLAAQKVVVTDKAEGADAVLAVLDDREESESSALSTSAQVREVELRRYFNFSLTDANGQVLIENAPISLRRFVSYNESQASAKSQEFEILFRDMRNDVVQQVLRRLAAAGKKPG